MYNISNEKVSIKKAIKYYSDIRIKLIALFYKDIENSFLFKLNRFFNKNLTVEEYFIKNQRDFYYYKKMDGKNYFVILQALKDLNVWLEAIDRGNSFTIDEYSYKEFLNYIKNNK